MFLAPEVTAFLVYLCYSSAYVVGVLGVLGLITIGVFKYLKKEG